MGICLCCESHIVARLTYGAIPTRMPVRKAFGCYLKGMKMITKMDKDHVIKKALFSSTSILSAILYPPPLRDFVGAELFSSSNHLLNINDQRPKPSSVCVAVLN